MNRFRALIYGFFVPVMLTLAGAFGYYAASGKPVDPILLPLFGGWLLAYVVAAAAYPAPPDFRKRNPDFDRMGLLAHQLWWSIVPYFLGGIYAKVTSGS